jgi:glycosyltransferase involved in cell wall biosynthesis
LGIPAGAEVLCFAGLDVLVDLPLVLESFESIARSRPDAILLLVGPRLSDLGGFPAELRSRVRCTGPVPYAALPSCLGAADVFLMPYANRVANVGRWPNKIGDYMSAGRPTVSNPVGEVKWLFERYRVGLLADATPAAMAGAVLRLLDDCSLAAEIGAEARRVAREHFDWSLLIQDLERWYYSVVLEGRSRRECFRPTAPERPTGSGGEARESSANKSWLRWRTRPSSAPPTS